MTLSEEVLQNISHRPLGIILDTLRDKLRDTNTANEPQQEDVPSLLSTLVGSTAAFSLPSPDGRGDVASVLLAILQGIRMGLV
jgi:hypothetical protein